jgi:hypothetical protein
MSGIEYYDSTGAPSTGSAGTSSTIRAEFDSIEAGFGKLPDLAGNANLPVFVNAGASSLETKSASAAATALGAELTANKDASGGYAGLTLLKINFKNVADTITSFFTNTNTVARTYTFQDRDGTIADDTDLALKADASALHSESHTVASHSDTTATGSELETLTDDSIADMLHRHSELSASDGVPNAAVSVDADGNVTMSYNATVSGTLGVTGPTTLSTLGLSSGTTISELSIDGTLAGNSDDAVPTEKAVKTYVDANGGGLLAPLTGTIVTGGITGLNCSVNAAAPTTTIDIGKGNCWDSLNGTELELSADTTMLLTTYYPSPASNSYYGVFVTDLGDIRPDDDIDGATLLAGAISQLRLIGVLFTDGSGLIVDFKQNDDEISLGSIAVATGLTVTATLYDFSAFFPVSRCKNYSVITSGSGTDINLRLFYNNHDDTMGDRVTIFRNGTSSANSWATASYVANEPKVWAINDSINNDLFVNKVTIRR